MDAVMKRISIKPFDKPVLSAKFKNAKSNTIKELFGHISKNAK